MGRCHDPGRPPLRVALHPGSCLALRLRRPSGPLQAPVGHPSAQVIGSGVRESHHMSRWAQALAGFLTHPEALESSSRSEDPSSPPGCGPPCQWPLPPSRARRPVFCPMSKSLSGKREGFQDNATRKKGKFIADWSQGSCRASNAVVRGQRALSLSCYPIYKVCISSW